MNKKFFLIGLVLLFYSLQGISQQCSIDKKLINPTPVEYSYDNIIHGDYYITANCNKTIAEEFRYSLNGGAYKKFEVKEIDYLSSKLIIETLELKKDTNLLTVLFNSCTTEIKFIFLRPTIENILVQQSGIPIAPLKDKNVYVIRDLADVQIDFKAVQKIVDVARRGNKAIDSLEYKIGNSIGNFTTMSGTDGRILIDKKNLVPGENLVYIRAKGKSVISSATLIEYSEVKIIRIFYIGFQLPQEFGSKGEIWKEDKLIKLSGQPDGGWYTGSGIVGNSNYFNPSLISENSGKVTYNYPYSGTILTCDLSVNIIYDSFELEGSQSVWRNSSDVKYEIKNASSNFKSYEWTCSYGTPASINAFPVNLITWNRDLLVGQSIGKVIVTGTHSSGAKLTRELSVFINNNVAYNKPDLFFGNNDETLVVCSDTKANSYKWYVDGVEQKTPSTPYFYYTGIGTLIRVEIITEKGAVTGQEIRRVKNMAAHVNSNSDDNLFGNIHSKDLIIYPNLAREVINVVFKTTESTSRIKVFDSSAKLLFETQTVKGTNSTQINTSKFPPGRYFVQLVNSSGVISEPFVKIN